MLGTLIKKCVFPLPPPHHPGAPGPGICGFSALYWTKISDELLPRLRTATTLVLQPLFDVLELDSFSHSDQKCSCAALGRTLANLLGGHFVYPPASKGAHLIAGTGEAH